MTRLYQLLLALLYLLFVLDAKPKKIKVKNTNVNYDRRLPFGGHKSSPFSNRFQPLETFYYITDDEIDKIVSKMASKDLSQGYNSTIMYTQKLPPPRLPPPQPKSSIDSKSKHTTPIITKTRKKSCGKLLSIGILGTLAIGALSFSKIDQIFSNLEHTYNDSKLISILHNWSHRHCKHPNHKVYKASTREPKKAFDLFSMTVDVVLGVLFALFVLFLIVRFGVCKCAPANSSNKNNLKVKTMKTKKESLRSPLLLKTHPRKERRKEVQPEKQTALPLPVLVVNGAKAAIKMQSTTSSVNSIIAPSTPLPSVSSMSWNTSKNQSTAAVSTGFKLQLTSDQASSAPDIRLTKQS